MSCGEKESTVRLQLDGNSRIIELEQDSIIARTFQHPVLKYEGYFSTEWQVVLDSVLEQHPSVAYLWQQKAMPLFKQGKYELGMPYLDKAVFYDPARYLDYRAFMKCIFAKQYRSSIEDFEECIDRYGNSYVMDHSYKFYIGLYLIQLNEFQSAEKVLSEEIVRQEQSEGEDWVHHLDLFYLGIAQYEQNKWGKAIDAFSRAIKAYPEFSDAQLYQSVCLRRMGQLDEADKLANIAKVNGEKGYTINEDNALYERYPYQIRWN